ncbi:hypothetical protein HMPREF1982_01899 [Clostridiales bacterium oral taxon 876 str. F0540]|nr:hypothetical protein HMPREF1982_01899 [Clostridiales bacterium oral taxon 876 str. F0540]
MLFTSHVLPTIFVQNKTNSTIGSIYFTYAGYRSDDPVIKNLESGKIDNVSMYSKGYCGDKSLIMYYYDKNKIKHEHIVYDRLGFDYVSDIIIQILSAEEDGSFNIKVDAD